MTDRMVVGADPRDGSEIDDNSDVIKVVIGKTRVPEIEPDPDEFDQAANVFKTMQGLSATVKKRASRMEKMHQGVGGVELSGVVERHQQDPVLVLVEPESVEVVVQLALHATHTRQRSAKRRRACRLKTREVPIRSIGRPRGTCTFDR